MNKTREIFMFILAGVVVLGIFAVIYLLVWHAVPELNKDALNIVLGALMAGFSLVLNYFFGSSRGSADKNDLLIKAGNGNGAVNGNGTTKPT